MLSVSCKPITSTLSSSFFKVLQHFSNSFIIIHSFLAFSTLNILDSPFFKRKRNHSQNSSPPALAKNKGINLAPDEWIPSDMQIS